jgi:MFS family permease
VQPPSRAYSAYVLGVLFLVYVFNFIDRQILGILIGPIQNELGVSDTAMGLLSGFSFAIFYTLAGIPIARISDRGSRRGVIAVSLALWSGMTAATGLAQNYLQLLLARIGVGVGEAGGSPPSHSLLSDYFAPERRATALALYANGIYVGAGLAFLLGGWVVTHFDWRVAYFGVGLAGLPLALLVRATVRELPRGLWEARAGMRVPAGAPPEFREAVRELFAKPTFGWLVAAACCQSLAGYGILNWGAEFLARVHGMTRLEIGSWMGPTILVGGCAGVTFGGWLADRLGARDRRWFLRLPAIVAVAGLPFAVLFLLLPGPAAALACFMPYYAISNMYVGPLWATAQNLARPQLRATASALLLFILNLVGLGLGPFAVGAANDLLAPSFGAGAIRWSLLGVVLTGGFASLLYWRASRTLEADLGGRGDGGEGTLFRGLVVRQAVGADSQVWVGEQLNL